MKKWLVEQLADARLLGVVLGGLLVGLGVLLQDVAQLLRRLG